MNPIYFDKRDWKWHIAADLKPGGMYPTCTDGGIAEPTAGDVVINGLSSLGWESYLPAGLTYNPQKGEATGEQHSRFTLESAES